MEEIVCRASDDRQCVRGSFYMNWSQAGCVVQKLSEDILPGIHELRGRGANNYSSSRFLTLKHRCERFVGLSLKTILFL